VFKKGKNSGSSCTAKVCAESTKYCRKHKENEGKENGDKPEKKASGAKAKKASDSKEKETASVKKLSEGKGGFVLRRNDHNNYEHAETHFVFDKVTKEVYGKQGPSSVEDLTTEDIETCKKLNFKYRMPVTLTSKSDSKDEEEDEVVEEEDEEEESEEEEEEDDEE